MTQLSIIGKGLHIEEHALGFYTSGDRLKLWAGRGAFWGSLGGTLFGNALLFIPAIGPLAGLIAGSIEGATLGGAAGALAAALVNLGVPRQSDLKYEPAVKAGRFVALARSSAGLLEEARNLLGTTDASKGEGARQSVERNAVDAFHRSVHEGTWDEIWRGLAAPPAAMYRSG